LGIDVDSWICNPHRADNVGTPSALARKGWTGEMVEVLWAGARLEDLRQSCFP
jgi:hypothetical protein